MGMLRSWASGWRALTHRRERNAEIEEEVREFVAASVAEKMGRG